MTLTYQDLREGRFYLGDNVDVMRSIPDGVIDLTVTSPPYDNLREYTGESKWIGIEIAQEYADLAIERIGSHIVPEKATENG